MTWIKLKLPADREEQKQIHISLRKEILSLLNSNLLDAFVMTYHKSSFHLCLDIPTLADYSMNALQQMNHMKRIIDITKPFLSRKEGGLSNYFKEVVVGQKETLSEITIIDIEADTKALAKRLIENASRGCKAALDILTNNLSTNLNPMMLYDLVLEKSYPLDGGLWISDSAHFCFNSLGIGINEEYAIRGYPVFSSINQMVEYASVAVKRLLNREGLTSI